ncbi:hypothetical protein [Rhizorhabdus argentea]|uniref:hypothetical protein n=1 Tax=Rhizorhabdus argentea TaxID=1387174 RepID=UPI0030EDEA80
MRSAPLLGLLVLAACGNDANDNVAARLDNAAAQSDPAAAAVLSNAADDLRANDSADPAAEAQNALQAAGNAQARPPSQ